MDRHGIYGGITHENGRWTTHGRQDYWRYTTSGANQLAMSAGLEAAAGKSMENSWKIWETHGKSLEHGWESLILWKDWDLNGYKTNHLCSLLIQGGAQIQAGW